MVVVVLHAQLLVDAAKHSTRQPCDPNICAAGSKQEAQMGRRRAAGNLNVFVSVGKASRPPVFCREHGDASDGQEEGCWQNSVSISVSYIICVGRASCLRLCCREPAGSSEGQAEGCWQIGETQGKSPAPRYEHAVAAMEGSMFLVAGNCGESCFIRPFVLHLGCA